MRPVQIAIAAALFTLALAVDAPRASATTGATSRAAPGQLAPDGLPVSIPSPGSPVPTAAEWSAVTQEVTVKGSSAYHCETKMVREWLRVSCSPRDSKWTPKAVTTLQPHDHQAYTGMFGDKASVVVQVVKGKLYVARFTWGPDDTTRDLSVNWAKGDRPLLGFN